MRARKLEIYLDTEPTEARVADLRRVRSVVFEGTVAGTDVVVELAEAPCVNPVTPRSVGPARRRRGGGGLRPGAAVALMLVAAGAAAALVLAASGAAAAMEACRAVEATPANTAPLIAGALEQADAVSVGFAPLWNGGVAAPRVFVLAPFPPDMEQAEVAGCWDEASDVVQVSTSLLAMPNGGELARMTAVHEMLHRALHMAGASGDGHHCVMAAAHLAERQLEWERAHGSRLIQEVKHAWLFSETVECLVEAAAKEGRRGE